MPLLFNVVISGIDLELMGRMKGSFLAGKRILTCIDGFTMVKNTMGVGLYHVGSVRHIGLDSPSK